MISVKLEGRLGNQLFQYAFIYAAAKKLNTSFYLDKSVDYLLLDKYFNIPSDFCYAVDKHLFSIKGYKNIFSHYSRWIFYYFFRHVLFIKKETFFDDISPESQFNKIRNNRIYIGHFQSEKYFMDYKEDIKQLFTIKNTYSKKFEYIFQSLPKATKYVTVHIRRGDYITNNIALDNDYYHKAIKSVHADENYYIFISDDTGFVNNEFDYLPNKYISKNDEIMDFQFLNRADICIISNSSFSWWGAWLNNKDDKMIIAPKYWFGKSNKHEHPVGIINPEWTLLHDE